MKTPLLRFLLILLLSLCLHLALLLVPAGDAAHITANKSTPTQAQLEARLLPTEEQTSDALLTAPQSTNIKKDNPRPDPIPTVSTASPDTTTSGLSVPETSSYYPSQLLGEKPRILEDPLYAMAHKLPSEAAGKLVLRLRINEEGTIDSAIVEESDVRAAYLPQLQLAALGMRFTPGRINGQAVKTEMRIEVEIDSLRLWP